MINFGDDRLPERFWQKCSVDENGCWIWSASKSASGYGQFYWNGRQRPAHRVAYVVLVGAVSDELHCDHLCRVRCCANPAHIEPVTCKENIRRGICRELRMSEKRERTHCKRGHELTPENTFIKHWRRPDRLSSEGTVVVCRACKQLQAQLDYERALARGKRVLKGPRKGPRITPGCTQAVSDG